MLALEAGATGGEGDSRCTPNGIPSDAASIEVDPTGATAGSYLKLSVAGTGSTSAVVQLRAMFDTWRATHPCPGGAGGVGGGGGTTGRWRGGRGRQARPAPRARPAPPARPASAGSGGTAGGAAPHSRTAAPDVRAWSRHPARSVALRYRRPGACARTGGDNLARVARAPSDVESNASGPHRPHSAGARHWHVTCSTPSVRVAIVALTLVTLAASTAAAADDDDSRSPFEARPTAVFLQAGLSGVRVRGVSKQRRRCCPRGPSARASVSARPVSRWSDDTPATRRRLVQA